MSRHGGLIKPAKDTFGWMDLGFFGTTCEHIRAVCAQLSEQLSVSTCYVDADHHPEESKMFSPAFANQWTQQGEKSELLSHSNIQEAGRKIRHLHRIALVNGNHFEAPNTVWIWNAAKEASARKRVHQRQHCRILVIDDISQLPDDLHSDLPHDIIILPNDSAALAQAIERLHQPPKLNGLVLGGGNSTRFGSDKAAMRVHDQPQLVRAYELLQRHCDEVYISTTEARETAVLNLFETTPRLLHDQFVNLGPFGGIATAFRTAPDAAWLVLATDLPGVTDQTIEKLLANRSFKHTATAFLNQETGFADPLCAIYEPGIYPEMMRFLADGFSCPRKVLINTPTHLVEDSGAALVNINTPEDLAAYKLRDGR